MFGQRCFLLLIVHLLLASLIWAEDSADETSVTATSSRTLADQDSEARLNSGSSHTIIHQVSGNTDHRPIWEQRGGKKESHDNAQSIRSFEWLHRHLGNYLHCVYTKQSGCDNMLASAVKIESKQWEDSKVRDNEKPARFQPNEGFTVIDRVVDRKDMEYSHKHNEHHPQNQDQSPGKFPFIGDQKHDLSDLLPKKGDLAKPVKPKLPFHGGYHFRHPNIIRRPWFRPRNIYKNRFDGLLKRPKWNNFPTRGYYFGNAIHNRFPRNWHNNRFPLRGHKLGLYGGHPIRRMNWLGRRDHPGYRIKTRVFPDHGYAGVKSWDKDMFKNHFKHGWPFFNPNVFLNAGY